jgi:hypothetical protein
VIVLVVVGDFEDVRVGSFRTHRIEELLDLDLDIGVGCIENFGQR